ncbi:MAG: hypothetical protein IPP90_00100 [Gemmatimonadaceae bacterium]|nr:hypothetical protein [Gemmatimonadaceae bacterium]
MPDFLVFTLRPTIETVDVPSRFMIPIRPRVATRQCGAWRLLLMTLVLTTGCDRLKNATSGGASSLSADPTWLADSALLAGKPRILFRTYVHEQGRGIAPIATIGAIGFRQVMMGGRGWKAFDVNYLRDGKTLTALRDGRAIGVAKSSRGMWESSGQLDSIPRCNLIPTGLTDAPPSVTLALSGSPLPVKPVTPLSDGELQDALAKVPTLIAPSAGIPISLLARYKREVHVMSTGVSSRPSILLIFNDPEQVPDTLQPTAQRPRQLVVVLDKGVYGYRPSYRYATLGNALSTPRLTFLDILDVDGDGHAEIFFGSKYRHIDRMLDATHAMRFENDAWREIFKESMRCP